MKRIKLEILVMIIFLSLPSISNSADIKNLSEKFPVSITDALPADEGELQAQLSVDYENDDDDRYLVTPDIEYGLTKDLQVELGTEAIYGTPERSGSGDVTIGAHYKLPVELLHLAVKGTLITPTGIDSNGLDSELGLLSTLELGTTLRTHLDLRWLQNGEPQPGERDNGLRTGFGLQHIYNERTSTLVSFVREVELEEDQEFNLVELGCLHSLGQNIAGGAAVGFGLGDDSPDLTARLAIQQEF